MKVFLDIVEKGDKILEKIITWALALCVMSMLLLTILAVVFRWFQFAENWSGLLVRHIVFVSAFLGGALASGYGAHIGIDVLGKLLERSPWKGMNRLIQTLVLSVSIFTVFWLSISSFDFMKMEFIYGKPLFLGIHSGHMVAIIPLGFLLIALRMFGRLVPTLLAPAKKE